MADFIRPLVLGAALLAAGCGTAEQPGDKANNFANADIETLPPDESAATPTEDLANGATEPTAAEIEAAQ